MRTLAFALILAACSNAADPTPDASGVPDATVDAPAGPPLDILRVNEVVASGAPDWVEIVNVSSAAVQLSEFCLVDVAGDFVKCSPLPAMSLAANMHFAHDCSDVLTGFGLGSDEEVLIYRIADQRLSDHVDWAEGDSPGGESFARIPDITGTFARTNMVTKGTANLANNPTAPLMTIIVNEVAAAEPASGDWIEVANATNAAINLQDYCYVDSSAAACHPFPTMSLAAGAYFTVDANDTVSGFGLGGDDAAIVKRISDMRISDTADWPNGAAGPAGMSYQRSPTITGGFVTAAQTKGVANL